MNKILACFSLTTVLVSAPVHANMELCKVLGDSAETTMKARQAGVAMSAALSSIPSELTGEGRRLLENIVVEAYKIPRFSSAEMQFKTVQDYRNRIELACFTTMGR